MILKRVIASFVIAGSLGVTALNAKDLRNAGIPAEFPPASYKGKQYVDSRGCVFVRAGIDGNVTWVPRVTRSRQQICGARPSGVSGSSQVAAASDTSKAVMLPDPDPDKPDAVPAPVKQVMKPRPVAKPVVQPVAKPAAKPVRVATAQAAPKPAPRPAPLFSRKPLTTVATTAGAPKLAPRPVASSVKPSAVAASSYRPAPVAQISPRRMAVPQSLSPVGAAPVARAKPMPVRPGSRRVAAPAASLGAGCAGLSAYARASYAAASGGVRCGPQGVAPVAGGYVAPAPQRMAQAAPGVRTITPKTRIVPKHVYQTQKQSADVGKVPSGYRRVWTDDRLNTKRAHQTLEGRAMMESRWTRTVPAQLKTPALDRPSFNADVVSPTANTRRGGMFGGAGGLTVRTGPQTESPVSYLPTGQVVSSQGSAVRAAKARVKAPVAHLSSKSVAKAPAAPKAKAQKAPKAAVKTPARATPKPAPAAPKGHRYVQVGSYADPASARAAIARLHRAGLPVRKKVTSKGGKEVQVIVTGPYGSSSELGKALSRARRAGFSGAFTHR